jgi:hypothetical protein
LIFPGTWPTLPSKDDGKRKERRGPDIARSDGAIMLKVWRRFRYLIRQRRAENGLAEEMELTEDLIS